MTVYTPTDWCSEMLQEFNEKNRDLLININGRLSDKSLHPGAAV